MTSAYSSFHWAVHRSVLGAWAAGGTSEVIVMVASVGGPAAGVGRRVLPCDRGPRSPASARCQPGGAHDCRHHPRFEQCNKHEFSFSNSVSDLLVLSLGNGESELNTVKPKLSRSGVAGSPKKELPVGEADPRGSIFEQMSAEVAFRIENGEACPRLVCNLDP